MLFKSKKTLNIISLPDHPAEITHVGPTRANNEEWVKYQFEVLINESVAMQHNALDLNVDIYKEEPAPLITATSIKNTKSWAKVTKGLERDVQRNRLVQDAGKIASRVVDLSAYISNDLTNTLSISSKSIGSLSRKQSNSVLARSSIVSPKNPFASAQINVIAPSTQGILKPIGITSKKGTNTPLDSSITQGISVNPPPSKSFSKTMLSLKSDPASLNVISQKSLSPSSKSIVAKSSAFVFSPPTSLPVMKSFRIFPEKKKITFSVHIRRSLLNDKSSFYLSMVLEDEFGVPVSSASKTISHTRILNSYLTPSLPPHLEAEYIKPGIITVITKKHPHDSKSKRIKVFRRLSISESASTDFGTPWTEVLDSPIPDTGEFIFRDTVASSRPVIYRAICYGENFKPSEKFASTVVLPPKEFVQKQSGSLTAIAKIQAPGINSFVTVDIKDIPYDVITVMVRRYNLTTASYSKKMSGKGAGFIYVGSTPSQQQILVENIDNDSAVSFLDESTKVGNNYSYVPVGITKTGKEIVGSSFALEIPYSPKRAQVSIFVTSPKSESGAVTMGLSGKFTDFGFSEVRRALASGQQANLFATDLLEDRSRFESLIGFLVERTNTKTGECESFGTYTAGEFSDDATVQQEKNIKPLQAGIEYTYIVTGLLNTPETLFPTLVKKEIDIRTLTPFTKKVAKFQNSLALNRSTLQSTARQVNRSLPSALEPTDPLVAGRTNVQVYKDFRLPISLFDRSNVRIERHKRFNRLVWAYSDPDNIDHFRIYLVASGGKVLLDTVHCDASTAEFYYRHYDKDSDVNFRYEVQPIDLSYKELKKITTKSVAPISLSKTLSSLSTDRIVKL